MNTRTLIAVAFATAAATVVSLPTFAASEAQSKQQNRMARCNQEAAGQKGTERKAFMKQCLSGASKDATADVAAKPARKAAAR